MTFLLALVLAAAPSPAPSPSPLPKEVKVTVPSTVLIESPELFDECRDATLKAAEIEPDGWDWEAEREKAAARYTPSAKPVDQMTDDERKGWKARRDTLIAEQDAIEARHRNGVEAKEEATRACEIAAMGPLLKGAILAVLREKGDLLNVRVETGRSAGKIGWVLRAEVAAEESK